jgi:type IV secretion system protein VirB10
MKHPRILLPLFLIAGTLAAAAQTAPTMPPAAQPAAASQSAPAQPAATPPPAQAAPAPAAVPASNPTFTVPAGTKVLLELRSAINTKSAKPGDGVYLASTFPVVVGNRVLIPSGVYVQGVIDTIQRPGRGFGKNAQLNMHFTSMIFPNGSVVEIPGMVNSLPGAEHQSVNGEEGTIQQQGGSQQGHNAGETAKVAVPTGATIGSIGGLNSGHPLEGGLAGAGAGLAAAGIVALFTHKADINIPSGSQVEMVIQRPLVLEENTLNGPTTLVPAAAQQTPMAKPALRDRPAMVCPPGSLGCS